MAGKLNFAIALKMTTDQFKKGSDFVKRSLKSMQYQVLGMVSAFGIGAIGLKGFASQFINVARETNRARVALKNISGDATGFANNMNFLIRTSTKWGQELNGMTSEYAKFSAAASSAGISVKDQQTIFESFTRSITGFGMSSEDAHLSYLALSQMMSKGKISSEELRRQLGERMPIAMEAMARAVGVTIQELDGLLKAGKLLSKDVMMPFVQEMEKMLPTVDVDNIETSVNRLKNTFIKLTEDLKIGEFYKKVVDGANKMLSGIQSSFVRVIAVIANTYITGKLISAFKSLTVTANAENAKLLANKIATEEQVKLAMVKRVAAEKNFERLSVLYNKASNEQKLAFYTRYKSAERTLDQARLREKSAILAKDVAANAVASTKTQTIWTVSWTKIGSFAKGAILSIRSALSSIVPMAIIGLMTNFVFKLIEARKEAEKIKNIFTDYRRELDKVGGGREAVLLQTSLDILRDKKSTQEEIKNAQESLNGILGTEITLQDELLKKGDQRIKQLVAMARADFQANKIVEAEEEEVRLAAKAGLSVEQMRGLAGSIDKPSYQYDIGRAVSDSGVKGKYDVGKIDGAVKEFAQNSEVLSDAWIAVRKATADGTYKPNGSTSVTSIADIAGGGSEEKATPLEKVEQKYIDELTKLTNQKESGVISTKDYNKAVDELNQTIYEEIGGLLGTGASLNETFKKAMAGVENPLSAGRLTEVTDDYSKTLKELDEKKRLGLLSEEGYNDALLDLISATIDKVSSFDKITKAEEKYIKNLSDIQKDVAVAPTKESRDTTFDYKKTESDILSEQRALQDRYVQDLKSNMDKLKDYGVEAMEEIKKEEDKLTSLSEALKLAQLKEDIKDLNLDLFDESVDGVTGFANALDRVSKSWSRIASEDMSSFERIIAIINAMGDTIGAIVGTLQSYLAIQELIGQREKARSQEKQVETAIELSNIGALTAAEAAANASTVIGSGAVATAKGVEATANTAAAATGAAASVAGIPLVGAAMAVAAVASVLGALSSLPKFANGGIVGGVSKSGDKQLVRVNAGEMIMNTTQQSKLWGAIQKGEFGGGSGGDVEFKIKGNELVGILKQHNQKMSRR